MEGEVSFTLIAEWLYQSIKKNDQTTVECILEAHRDLVPNLIRPDVSRFFYLHEACKTGSVEIIQLLLQFYTDIFTPSDEGSPLKLACEYGHVDVVELLLQNGALVDLPVSTHPSSACFQAALHGYHEILDLLIEYNPDVASVPNSCGILLYAACLGGHVDMVERWLCEDIDVNWPVQILPADAHQFTPVMAAIKGGNDEVLELLIERGGIVTQAIAKSEHRDVVRHLLHRRLRMHSVVSPDSTQEGNLQYNAKWQHLSLTCLHPNWITPYCDTLIEVNLSYNRLSSLPKCIPWEMPVLKILDVSHNALLSLQTTQFDYLRLEEFNLSHNRLKSLPVAVFQLPELRLLYLRNNFLEKLTEGASPKANRSRESVFKRHGHHDRTSGDHWYCFKLHKLDLCNNELKEIPSEVEACGSLTKLLATHNSLEKFPYPWACQLDYLDLAHNSISSVPSSVTTFWGQTLKTLYLQHNKIRDMGEGICGLGHLVDLDLSHNEITALPKSECWKCLALMSLNLADNKLSNRTKDSRTADTSGKLKGFFKGFRISYGEGSRIKEKKDEETEDIFFPDVIRSSLRELDLSQNKLTSVPVSVTQLTQLTKLDLSHNPGLHYLPPELGNLSMNCQLNLNGLRLRNIPMGGRKGVQLNSKVVLACLKSRLRMSVPYNRMKLVVVGRENRGKTTLLSCLKGKPNFENLSTNGVDIGEWTISGAAMKKRKRSKETLPDIVFSTWDMGGQQDYYITHQCFLSVNSLYMVVWDMRLGRDEGVGSLQTWLSNIQARAPDSSVIIVGTFMDCINPVDKARHIAGLQDEISTRYMRKGYPKIVEIIEVSSRTGEGIGILEEVVYTAAKQLKVKSVFDSEKVDYIGRQVPKSYVVMETLVQQESKWRIQNRLPPVLTEDEFTELIARHGLDKDIGSPEERMLVAEFLHESGIMLHYNDQLRGLNTLYFTDPSWLVDLMAKIITIRTVNSYVRDGILRLEHAELLFLDERLPKHLLPQYIQLLERFEIALAIDKERLLLPSKLPLEKPGLNLDEKRPASVTHENKVHRLYKMAYIPSGFWSRLITRLIVIVQRLAEGSLKGNDDTLLHAERKPGLTKNRSWNQSIKKYAGGGLKLANKRMVYWREGLIVTSGKDYFIVESADPDHRISTFDKIQGIYITVYSISQDFSALGFLVDQLELLMQEWFPGLLDDSVPGFPIVQRLVPCPVCLTLSSNARYFHNVHLFTFEECGCYVCNEDKLIECPRHPARVSLQQLAPDLLLLDLPKNLIIDPKQIEFFADHANLLGYGAEGAVYEGQYKDKKVAVKQLYGHMIHQQFKKSEMTDSGNPVSSSASNSSSSIPADTTLSLSGGQWYTGYSTEHMTQIVKSLNSLRQEVMLLSKLKHPCVVALLAVNIPQMYFVIELAPLGSLQSVLDTELENRRQENRNQMEMVSTLLSRPITYKIILQIATALAYLHQYDITYRDLKPDNVLVWSIRVEDAINVKISDYGISSYNTPQGLMGCEGTPGYQAPEVRVGMAYDEKVDIFSLSMLMYGLLSGRHPFSHLDRTLQRTDAVRAGERPSLMQYNVCPEMPALVELMQICWSQDPVQRPSALDIAEKLRDVSMLCDRVVLPSSDQDPLPEITCLDAPTEDPNNPYTWLWTGSGSSRMYHVLEVRQGTFKVKNRLCPGGTVQCMARVGRDVWIGTQEKELEIIGYERAGRLGAHVGYPSRIGQPVKTRGVPLAILYQSVKVDENEAMKRVYVSQSDGSVTVYAGMDSWTELTTISVNDGEALQLPARCMAFANGETELWVGSGHRVVFISTHTLEEEGRLDVFDPSSNLLIAELMIYGSRAWIATHKCSQIVEMDTDSKEIMVILDCSGDDLIYRTIVRSEEQTESLTEQSSADGSSHQSDASYVPKPVPRFELKRRASRKSSRKKHNVKAQAEFLKKISNLKMQRITAMTHVKDTLWVARGTGDILVINTNPYSTCGYSYGQVLAVFKPLAEQFHYMKMSNTNANRVVCASVIQSSDAENKDFETKIVIRDAYGTEDIHSMHTMWKQLSDEETKMENLDSAPVLPSSSVAESSSTTQEFVHNVDPVFSTDSVEI